MDIGDLVVAHASPDPSSGFCRYMALLLRLDVPPGGASSPLPGGSGFPSAPSAILVPQVRRGVMPRMAAGPRHIQQQQAQEKIRCQVFPAPASALQPQTDYGEFHLERVRQQIQTDDNVLREARRRAIGSALRPSGTSERCVRSLRGRSPTARCASRSRTRTRESSSTAASGASSVLTASASARVRSFSRWPRARMSVYQGWALPARITVGWRITPHALPDGRREQSGPHAGGRGPVKPTIRTDQPSRPTPSRPQPVFPVAATAPVRYSADPAQPRQPLAHAD
jgi:hypothetical protein